MDDVTTEQCNSSVNNLTRTALNANDADCKVCAGVLLGLIDGEKYPLNLRATLDCHPDIMRDIIKVLSYLNKCRRRIGAEMSSDQKKKLIEMWDENFQAR